ncbi:mitochondrial 2-methylisocitrate lyase [Marasmius sp. AFHP31]|nr:mitochondrial 2-methylisocitrate lyase [Marasmius sp. AFHP31]
MWNELEVFKPPTTPANTEDLCAADIGPENSLISLASSNGQENLISRSLAQRVGTDLLLPPPPQPWHFPSNPLPSKKKHSSSPNKSLKWAISSPNHVSSTKRTYTAFDVASKQGSLPVLPPVSNLLANKLHAIITKAAGDGKPVLTMGAIEPVQMTQMARFQKVVSVSGHYPYTTVPNQVHRIFRAQQLHDKRYYDERVSATPEQREKMVYVDSLRPIVADADTGAFTIHFEDQLHGGKKCSHLSGKVLVPTSTHTFRLVSARFQLDLVKSTRLIIAQTDAESGKLISSVVDVADHKFVKGTTVPGKPLAEVTGAEGKEVDRIEGEWMASVAEAAIKVSTIKDKEGSVKTLKDATVGKSISDMREIAKGILGAPVFWDYEMPRTREGYYHLTSGLGRATTFAPYADLVWLETKTPDIEEARYFARKIRETYPETRSVYNSSPRFNWSAHGFSAELATRYKEDGMLAYVQLVQRKEKEIGCDVLTHQKWSGANYVDKIV